MERSAYETMKFSIGATFRWSGAAYEAMKFSIGATFRWSGAAYEMKP